MPIRRLLLVRHGETEGESSIRYHGSTDVDLSVAGRLQMERVAAELCQQAIDAWVASSLRRSWRGAAIVSREATVRMDDDFREIDFGRWEGLTAQEIRMRDPDAYERWQNGPPGFDFPGGEVRASFRARVAEGAARLVAERGHCAAAVLHKGVIREIIRSLAATEIEQPAPALGQTIVLTRGDEGWRLGQRGSDPPGVNGAVQVQAAGRLA